MQFPVTLPLVGRKIPNPGTKWIFFRLDLLISGHFQQLWVQLAEKLPLRSQTGNFLDWIYPFQAISKNFGLSWQLSPPSRKTGIFLFWIYPFHAISSNFAFNWQKNPQPRNQMEFFETGFIHFRPFSATLSSAGRKAPSQEPNRQFFRLNLSISGNFQQFWV